jgi:hypothetical protein
MYLSSYQRLLRYCGGDSILTDNAINRRQLGSWLPSISDAVENWLNRGIEIKTITEYFDVNFNTNEFYPKQIPVISFTSVYSDSTGLWDGGESELSDDDYHAGTNNDSIVLTFARPYEARRGLRAIYLGGLAYHGTQSVYAATITGTFTIGDFVHGGNSEAVGIVKAVTATSLTIEVLYGRFELGETVTEWATEDGIGAGTATAILTTATKLGIAEAYPEITRGVELQIRYMMKNKDRFEQGSVNKDGTSSRRGSIENDSQLQPEATMMLQHLRRFAI